MSIRVEGRPGESMDKLLRRFKKVCEKEGLSKDVRKNAYYEKPSVRRRRKMANAARSRAKSRDRSSADSRPAGRTW
jgi:small subunit ribosomal protein S21